MYTVEYDRVSEEQARKYLEGISLCYPGIPTLETLDALIWSHQCKVPFENIDTRLLACPVSLSSQDLYRKIVEERHGGFCFELNGLFLLLLQSLGFKAYACVCRVAAGFTSLRALTHRASIVSLNGKEYLCDVGLGGPMAPFAVELSPEPQTKKGETYRVTDTGDGWKLLLRREAEGTDSPVIIFARVPFLSEDFTPLMDALLARPDNLFSNHLVINLRTPEGYKNFRDNTLIWRTGKERKEIRYAPEDIPDMIRNIFGLNYDRDLLAQNFRVLGSSVKEEKTAVQSSRAKTCVLPSSG